MTALYATAHLQKHSFRATFLRWTYTVLPAQSPVASAAGFQLNRCYNIPLTVKYGRYSPLSPSPPDTPLPLREEKV
jgi:hypothetical protein